MMKKLSVLLIVSALIVLTAFPVGASFTADLPDYVSISGGAWFEVYSSDLGSCTIVFPFEFKEYCLAFSVSGSGLPVDIINVTNSTIYGLVFTSNGTQYNCRANRFSTIQYQDESTTYNQWRDLNVDVVGMDNSNIQFITDDFLYYNDTVIDYNKVNLALSCVIAIVLIINLFVSLLRKGRRVY